MQIIVNCCVYWQGGIVMIQKPRRGWWYLPGGKVDPGEIWIEAAAREVLEETGLAVQDLRLRGIHLVQIEPGPDVEGREQAIIQFSAARATGNLLTQSKEGHVAIVKPEEVAHQPMNEGDRRMVEAVLRADAQGLDTLFYGKFRYTAEHQLLDWRLLPETDIAAALEIGLR
ncbi:MAG: NUDIX domain-containing protein [Alicyclobacillus herbarius]|uniref:NUDIX domain-containing protein n=1 Tax=Alicyclobacillus herbarius TaxID=122960 RepID=UPI0003F96A98|nr:NUDIX domain-containing protein [Alicyclobacillus herbarius]MCL6631340.1 NUDIX domain-containing protein [Alicyclobacillus herbarius]